MAEAEWRGLMAGVMSLTTERGVGGAGDLPDTARSTIFQARPAEGAIPAVFTLQPAAKSPGDVNAVLDVSRGPSTCIASPGPCTDF